MSAVRAKKVIGGLGLLHLLAAVGTGLLLPNRGNLGTPSTVLSGLAGNSIVVGIKLTIGAV
jgi:hypothetical protein